MIIHLPTGSCHWLKWTKNTLVLTIFVVLEIESNGTVNNSLQNERRATMFYMKVYIVLLFSTKYISFKMTLKTIWFSCDALQRFDWRQNRECTRKYSRRKVEKRHGRFGKSNSFFVYKIKSLRTNAEILRQFRLFILD